MGSTCVFYCATLSVGEKEEEENLRQQQTMKGGRKTSTYSSLSLSLSFSSNSAALPRRPKQSFIIEEPHFTTVRVEALRPRRLAKKSMKARVTNCAVLILAAMAKSTAHTCFL